jgi:hypothetical protein
LLAAVNFPIIGVDFLKHYRLLVDPANNRLLPDQSTLAQLSDSRPPPQAITATAATLQCAPSIGNTTPLPLPSWPLHLLFIWPLHLPAGRRLVWKRTTPPAITYRR